MYGLPQQRLRTMLMATVSPLALLNGVADLTASPWWSK